VDELDAVGISGRCRSRLRPVVEAGKPAPRLPLQAGVPERQIGDTHVDAIFTSFCGRRFDSARLHKCIASHRLHRYYLDVEKIKLVCSGCGEFFMKAKKEYARQKKRGQERFFCTQSCRTSLQNKEVPRGTVEHLKADNRRDEMTPFRWYILRVKGRPRHGRYTVTLQYLKRLWEEQKGICPLTGWKLVLPDSTNGWKKGLTPKSASLDRVNCEKGCVSGNVRFVSVMANLARGRFSDEELEDFCRAVARMKVR
jgi:hypothetical protein